MQALLFDGACMWQGYEQQLSSDQAIIMVHHWYCSHPAGWWHEVKQQEYMLCRAC